MNKFKVGDKVEVLGYYLPRFEGLKGQIVLISKTEHLIVQFDEYLPGLWNAKDSSTYRDLLPGYRNLRSFPNSNLKLAEERVYRII